MHPGVLHAALSCEVPQPGRSVCARRRRESRRHTRGLWSPRWECRQLAAASAVPPVWHPVGSGWRRSRQPRRRVVMCQRGSLRQSCKLRRPRREPGGRPRQALQEACRRRALPRRHGSKRAGPGQPPPWRHRRHGRRCGRCRWRLPSTSADRAVCWGCSRHHLHTGAALVCRHHSGPPSSGHFPWGTHQVHYCGVCWGTQRHRKRGTQHSGGPSVHRPTGSSREFSVDSVQVVWGTGFAMGLDRGYSGGVCSESATRLRRPCPWAADMHVGARPQQYVHPGDQVAFC